MRNPKHSSDRSTAKPLLSQSTHPQIKFLAQPFGVSAQVFNCFGFQEWRDFTPRHQMGQFKEAALLGTEP